MAWDQIQGNWREFKGKVKQQWGNLTDDDLDRIAGQRDQLIGTLQQRYGKARDALEREVRDFEDRNASSERVTGTGAGTRGNVGERSEMRASGSDDPATSGREPVSRGDWVEDVEDTGVAEGDRGRSRAGGEMDARGSTEDEEDRD
jgi:uncharacterized protein YjbJ (UPF0337 family)